jgi:hypothetical protein
MEWFRSVRSLRYSQSRTDLLALFRIRHRSLMNYKVMDWNPHLRMAGLFSVATINFRTMYDTMVVWAYCVREETLPLHFEVC